MNRSEKKDFVKKLKEELSSSSSVIVAHYSGITVDETDKLRKEMRNNGAKFKVTKNRLTKLALEDTQFKSLADLFSGPTAIAYAEDPVAPAKVAVSFEKKIENFKIIGGGYDGEKMDKNKITGSNIYNLQTQKTVDTVEVEQKLDTKEIKIIGISKPLIWSKKLVEAMSEIIRLLIGSNQNKQAISIVIMITR